MFHPTMTKNQLPFLVSTQLVFFDETHIQQSCGPLTTSQIKEYNVLFPIYKEGNVDV